MKAQSSLTTSVKINHIHRSKAVKKPHRASAKLLPQRVRISNCPRRFVLLTVYVNVGRGVSQLVLPPMMV